MATKKKGKQPSAAGDIVGEDRSLPFPTPAAVPPVPQGSQAQTGEKSSKAPNKEASSAPSSSSLTISRNRYVYLTRMCSLGPLLILHLSQALALHCLLSWRLGPDAH